MSWLDDVVESIDQNKGRIALAGAAAAAIYAVIRSLRNEQAELERTLARRVQGLERLRMADRNSYARHVASVVNVLHQFEQKCVAQLQDARTHPVAGTAARNFLDEVRAFRDRWGQKLSMCVVD